MENDRAMDSTTIETRRDEALSLGIREVYRPHHSKKEMQHLKTGSSSHFTLARLSREKNSSSVSVSFSTAGSTVTRAARDRLDVSDTLCRVRQETDWTCPTHCIACNKRQTHLEVNVRIHYVACGKKQTTF